MGPPDLTAFGLLLRQHRTGAVLTQEELAERSGLSARVVSDVERGTTRRPQAHTGHQLVEALGLTGIACTAFLAAARGQVSPGPGTRESQSASFDPYPPQ